MINEEDVIARDLPLLRQRMQAEAAAEGRKLEDSSDEELTKRAEEMGGDASNYQSAYTLGRRADGTPGLDINKPRQKTLAQLIRGDQEPLPAFFEGVTEAMQQALSEINTQRINYKVSPNAGREVETRPLGDDPVTLTSFVADNPGFQAEEGDGVLPRNKEREGFDQQEFRERLAQLQDNFNKNKVAPQPLQSGRGQKDDGRSVLGDVREVFRPNDVQFVDTTWKHYTGVLTPEKRERALNDLKVYETLSKEEKFPPELMDVVKTVAASKPGIGGGRQLSYTQIKDYLSRISYVESKHKNISQIGAGPLGAVSAFQVEPITAESLINLERISKKYFNSSSFNEALDDEFDRVAETNPELMSGYLSYKNQGEDKAVYKAMQDLSIEQIIKLMSISPAFAGSMAYAKIITGLKSNVRKKDKEKLEKARAERETRQGMQEGGVPLPRNKPSVTEKKKVAS